MAASGGAINNQDEIRRAMPMTKASQPFMVFDTHAARQCDPLAQSHRSCADRQVRGGQCSLTPAPARLRACAHSRKRSIRPDGKRRVTIVLDRELKQRLTDHPPIGGMGG